MSFMDFSVGDTVKLKKKHACGSDLFLIKRVGSDVKISCLGCQRELLLERAKFESSIKKITIKEK